MRPKQKASLMAGVLTALFVLPLWYCLLYGILQRVGASDLMWVLYWVYLPIGMVAHILGNIFGEG
jgi:hypothetical protein